MPVNSLPEDKPKIAFHSAMMAIQNFGFFMVSKFYSPKLKKDIPSLTHHSIVRYAPQMYWDIWGATSYDTTCQGTRNSTGMMAMTCFCETFLCVAALIYCNIIITVILIGQFNYFSIVLYTKIRKELLFYIYTLSAKYTHELYNTNN